MQSPARIIYLYCLSKVSFHAAGLFTIWIQITYTATLTGDEHKFG
jgi:hypothetical protein